MNLHCLTLERPRAHVARVTLNEPSMRNALHPQCIEELTLVFGQVAQDPDVRVVILAAQGSVFCAGAHLQWMQSALEWSPQENLLDAQALAHMLHTLYTCAVPVIARVQGDCYGGGVGLAAACDIVVAADQVQFCLSEAKLGLVPATISPYVVRALGPQACRRYFLTAERFSAQCAQALGWVHEVVPVAHLDQQVDALAQAIAANGPLATRACKALVQTVMHQELSEPLIAETARLIAEVRATPEAQEGVLSFLQKRPPEWSRCTAPGFEA